MEYKEHIAKAIDYIEENLQQDISLAACAKVSGYSQYHFLRLFKYFMGLTPADYIRKRRLSEIAKAMMDSDEYISALAFQYGFNSKENFVRAFKTEHHILPTEYKSVANSLKLYDKITFENADFMVSPSIISIESFTVIGYKSDEDIPANFWNRYNAKGLSKVLSGGKVVCDYGVCIRNLEKNKLDYYIGVKDNEAKGDLRGTHNLMISGGLYALFSTPPAKQSDFVAIIHKTWDYILNTWMPQSEYTFTDGHQFECYVEESRVYSEDIYIPITKKIRRNHMKKIDITWNETFDSTGYLFSFAKALSTAVKNSPYSELAEDIVASSGFAFRMWIAADLCPSETSIWDFGKQPAWILNGGIETTHDNCLWQPENVLSQARMDALPKIIASIDRGVPVIAWDIGVCEWGLVIGYDNETQKFATLCINGNTDEMDYAKLGNREMPMLNVITITSKTEKGQEEIVADTKALAKAHLNGEEWCENAQGLASYPMLIHMLESDDSTLACCWEMEYALGTYGSLKWYAWKFFEKYSENELASLYKTVYESWQNAFDIKKSTNLSTAEDRKAVANLMKTAYECEKKAIQVM